MIKLKQAVIVEGKYDKAKLSSLVDATIVTTDGFDVFRDREKLAYIRALAEKNGVIILTDSDAAGFRIRAHIAGAVDPEKITHVYIPDIFGKERRKAQPSAEGKLGVEGMPAGVLLDALRRAGVAVEGQDAPAPAKRAAPVTKADLVEWGLSGGPDSAGRRRRVLAALGLPARMNANAMLSAINALYTRGEFLAFLETH
ncbi:toprim domain-containing protein [Anaerotruncus sp. DFI.9.16]|uniref:toprim domain-containing protein n=1 Tax=Anaerotruncus sp. DFI.9.16 TaxID=2965275 RepID=UPI00210CFA3F|nr:DUF4093 domain-containing protein [Anaerotruncus sp. DFI.9.16]MCQ4896445.1 DUF4093 domain-containing protein [Anaerotruncus sp. DFI.9.16]